MNKLVIVSVIFLLFVGNAAEAQKRYYLGGSANVMALSSDSHSNFSMILSPDLGFQLGETWMFGIKVNAGFAFGDGIEMSLNKGNSNTDVTVSGDGPLVMLGASPYARYHFLDLGPVGLWAEGDVILNGIFGNSSVVQYGVSAFPMVTYDLSDHFMLYSTLDFLSLDLMGLAGDDYNTFGLVANAQTSRILSLGDFSVGFLYRF